LNQLPSRPPTPLDGLILYNKRDDVAGEDFWPGHCWADSK
jgi:hypothetical protein